MTNNEELARVAKELFWWQAPAVSLANPRRFLAQVMTLGTWQEVQAVKDAVGWDAFKDALARAAGDVRQIPDLQPLPGGIAPAT